MQRRSSNQTLGRDERFYPNVELKLESASATPSLLRSDAALRIEIMERRGQGAPSQPRLAVASRRREGCLDARRDR